MSQELVIKENTQLASITTNDSLSSSGISMSDIKPTYISVQQKMSKSVDQGICKPGDILETPVNIILGGEGRPVEVLPIFMRKEWQSYWVEPGQKKEPNQKPFRREPYSSANSHWKFKDFIDGKGVNNDLIIIWCVIPVGEGALPSLISFRGMSGRVGQNIIQLVTRLAAAKLPAYAKTIKLDSVKESNEKGSYFVFKAAFGRDASPEEIAHCKQWQEMMTKKPEAVSEAISEEGDDSEAVPF